MSLLKVTGKTLRLTTLQDGKAVGYSDFVRLETFTPEDYGTCSNADLAGG